MFLRSLLNTLLSILLLSLATMCVIFQNEVSAEVYEAFVRCITDIIPPLFAMSVISSIIMRSGALKRLLSRAKFDIESLNAFIFGNIGGYPIGARLCSEMVSECTYSKECVSNLFCSSFNCGPAFAIAVSYAIYGNAVCGLGAYLSILLSNLILYIIYIAKNRSSKQCDDNYCFNTSTVVESVINSAHSMINITAMICAFSVVTALLKCLFPSLFTSTIQAIFEISKICDLQYPSLWVVTSLLSFGGLCVQMQVLSIASSKYNLKTFYISRLVQIPTAALISLIADRAFSLTESISVSTNTVSFSQSNSIVPFICVIFMLIIALNTKRKQRMS